MGLSWNNKDRARGWIGVDSGREGICGVSVRPPATSGGKPQIVKCGMVAANEFSSDALLQLSDKISVPGFKWTFPLDRSDYKIMVIPEPPVLPSEMEESIRWSLGTMIEYPADEASIAWIPIPTKQYLDSRPPHIYVIVTRNETVQRYTKLFHNAKLPLGALDVRETAQRNIASLLEEPGKGIGLIVMGDQGISITFTFGGELFLDRFIDESMDAILASDDEDKRKIFDRITLQVQRSIDFINRTLPFMTIGRIVISPLPSPLAFREHLAQNISEPVEMLDINTLFDLSLTPELRQVESQARYLSALGAALRGMERAS